MIGIIGVVAVLTVLGLSLLVTKLATVALTMTGLSEHAALFQARSAFSGTGFTTREAETVVDHPVRRRIIMWLFILRSAGIVTVVLSLILSFIGQDGDKLYRLGWLVAGVFVLLVLANLPWVDRGLRRVMIRVLRRWTELDARDYFSLLRLSGEYRVHELQVRDDDWVAGRDLAHCQLQEEGILVLGILRSDGRYIGAPQGSTELRSGDTLILYGRRADLAELDRRRRGAEGDAAHHKAVGEQRRHVEEERREESGSGEQRR